jgi:transcription termination factor Rho
VRSFVKDCVEAEWEMMHARLRKRRYSEAWSNVFAISQHIENQKPSNLEHRVEYQLLSAIYVSAKLYAITSGEQTLVNISTKLLEAITELLYKY